MMYSDIEMKAVSALLTLNTSPETSEGNESGNPAENFIDVPSSDIVKMKKLFSMCKKTMKEAENPETTDEFVNSGEPVAGPSRYNNHRNVSNTSESDEGMSFTFNSTSTSSEDGPPQKRTAMDPQSVTVSQSETQPKTRDVAVQTEHETLDEIRRVRISRLQSLFREMYNIVLIMSGERPRNGGTVSSTANHEENSLRNNHVAHSLTNGHEQRLKEAIMQVDSVQHPVEQLRERSRRYQEMVMAPQDEAGEQLVANGEATPARQSPDESYEQNGTGINGFNHRSEFGEPGPSNDNTSTPRRVTRALRVAAQSTNNQDMMVPLGHGNARIPLSVWNNIPWDSHTIATRHLLEAVFPRIVLATSSLTGKRSPAFTDRAPKKALDPLKVEDIVKTVTERLGVSVAEVRNAITVKCSDEAKMYRKRTGQSSSSTNSDGDKLPSPISSLSPTSEE